MSSHPLDAEGFFTIAEGVSVVIFAFLTYRLLEAAFP